MKRLLFLLILLVVLAGCSGSFRSGDHELTVEEVQEYARQTLTAQAVQTEESSSGNLLIRPVMSTVVYHTAAPTDSGIVIASPTPENGARIIRPTFVATTIPTATPGFFNPVYDQPTATSPYAQPTMSSPYAQPVTTVCDRIRFIEDVTIDDDTVVAPGQTFRKIWRIQNSGTCTWSSGYQLVYVSGDAMGPNQTVNLPGEVKPGEMVDIAVDLTAPNAYGTFQSNWKLRSPSGNIFGTDYSENDAIWVKIIVGNPGNLATVAPGVTPVNSGCSLISVNPAYKASFAPGAETDFIFSVRNNTDTTWDTDNMDIVYLNGENMLKRKTQTRKDLPYNVPPRGILEYTLDAIVPTTPGDYTMTMAVVNGNVILCTMDVTITVVY